MKKEKIFITGASGFLGKYLVKSLRDKYELHGLYCDEKHEQIRGIKPHRGNLLDYKEIGNILRKVKPDVIFHLGARTEVEKSFYDQVSFSEVNYCGTVNLIEEARKIKNLKQFVFASTMETYGEVYLKDTVLNEPESLKAFDETTPQKPNAPYAVAKFACEEYLRYAGRICNFPYTIIRQTNTYGRWDNDFFVTEQFITQMLKNEEEVNFGYAKPWRNLLFVSDLIDFYNVVLEKSDKAVGEIFCIGPDNALSMEELANKIAEKLNWKGKINWDTKPVRVGEIYYLNSNNKKATELLGWEPKVSLDEGLDKTISIWKEKLKK
jgi:UDP-glucose 4-epimerase